MTRDEWLELEMLAECHAPYLVGLLDQFTVTEAGMVLDQLRAKDFDRRAME